MMDEGIIHDDDAEEMESVPIHFLSFYLIGTSYSNLMR